MTLASPCSCRETIGTEGVPQVVVQNLDAGLQRQVCVVTSSPHLLFLHKTLTEHQNHQPPNCFILQLHDKGEVIKDEVAPVLHRPLDMTLQMRPVGLWSTSKEHVRYSRYSEIN
jgi:hypothetical protein